MAVARKLVAYLLAVDKRSTDFIIKDKPAVENEFAKEQRMVA